MSICGAIDAPVLASGDISVGFKNQSQQPYSHFSRGVHDICSLRFTSSTTPLQVYSASIAASGLPHMRVSAISGYQVHTTLINMHEASKAQC